MKKFYFRPNHFSVESEELEKEMYSWGLAGVLVFPWIKETPCVFATPNRNSSTFILSAVEWRDALKNQITEILNGNLSTEPIYFLSLWWHSFTTTCCCPISVEFYKLDLFLLRHFARSVVESSIATTVVNHETSLNAHFSDFSLEKTERLYTFSSPELRSNQFF